MCRPRYSPETVRERAFAFDGTVKSVEMRVDANLPVEEGQAPNVAWTTFNVNQWFKGGESQEVEIWVDPHTPGGVWPVEPGDRLLIAGEYRWRQPPEDPLAWGCGFTQRYTPEAAAQWGDAMLGTTAIPEVQTPVAESPVTATPDPDYVPSSQPLHSAPLPMVSPAERESSGGTWLYLAAFQNGFISIVDPLSGHALRQIPLNASQAGLAVSPGGARLYVADWLSGQEGQLRIFDTANWQVVHREPLPDLIRLLGGNPMTLSPDGRWLVVSFYAPDGQTGWQRVFDTESLKFMPIEAWKLDDCGFGQIRLIGQPGDPRVYVQCQGFVAVLNAGDLSLIRRIPSPTPFARDSLGWSQVGNPYLAVSPDGRWLYGLYPKIERKAE